MEALRSRFDRARVFWDVGASFGLHACTAKLLAPEMEVHAFEPNPESAARIRRNAELNNLQINVWPFALSDKDGVTTLHVAQAGNSGMTSIHRWPGLQLARTQTIETVRASTLIDSGRAPAPDIVKIDVEGHEAAVLAGFGGLLSAVSLRAIVIEGEANFASPDASDPSAKYLRDAGFSLRRLQRMEKTQHALENFVADRSVD